MSYRSYLDSFYGVKLTPTVNVKKWMKSEGGNWPSQSNAAKISMQMCCHIISNLGVNC